MTDTQAAFAHAYRHLQRQIDEAYIAFAQYKAPVALDGWEAHNPEQLLRDLTSAPLRELDEEMLGSYAGWAMTTVGDVADYKHFLPRILELAIMRATNHGLTPQIIASHLEYAVWHQWPSEEQSVVENVFQAAWAKARLLHPDEVDASDWLEGIAMLGLDLNTALVGWLANMTPASALQLASFLMSHSGLVKGSGFWKEVDIEQRRLLANWLTSDSVQAAFIETVDRVDESDRWLLDSADASVALL